MVAVHYRAWAEGTEHKFEDTWQEQRPSEMILGKGMVEVQTIGFVDFLLRGFLYLFSKSFIFLFIYW